LRPKLNGTYPLLVSAGVINLLGDNIRTIRKTKKQKSNKKKPLNDVRKEVG
jgi:hypothetical protein